MQRPQPSPAVPDALREYRIAASIYDGMIAPLMPFAIRGAFWYQGESNEARAQQYGILLPTRIRAWRERWGQGNFPFGIIQLPNYRAVKPEPADEACSHIREAQRRTALTTPNTGLIVTIDIGEANDIHPRHTAVERGLRKKLTVVHAKAGTQCLSHVTTLDSRVRGNDGQAYNPVLRPRAGHVVSPPPSRP